MASAEKTFRLFLDCLLCILVFKKLSRVGHLSGLVCIAFHLFLRLFYLVGSLVESLLSFKNFALGLFHLISCSACGIPSTLRSLFVTFGCWSGKKGLGLGCSCCGCLRHFLSGALLRYAQCFLSYPLIVVCQSVSN